MKLGLGATLGTVVRSGREKPVAALQKFCAKAARSCHRRALNAEWSTRKKFQTSWSEFPFRMARLRLLATIFAVIRGDVVAFGHQSKCRGREEYAKWINQLFRLAPPAPGCDDIVNFATSYKRDIIRTFRNSPFKSRGTQQQNDPCSSSQWQ